MSNLFSNKQTLSVTVTVTFDPSELIDLLSISHFPMEFLQTNKDIKAAIKLMVETEALRCKQRIRDFRAGGKPHEARLCWDDASIAVRQRRLAFRVGAGGTATPS
jgi:hypothetical protein